MRTRIIGLTGGIGSGKTTIARYFESLGVPVYIADDEAKKILYLPQAVQELAAAFGGDVLTDGQPDKAKLAAVVFNDAEKLKTLNKIIHPKVGKHFEQWAESHKDKKFVIKEAAILFESGSYKLCDGVILVTAPIDVRIQRVMDRDGVSREKVEERMAHQWSDEKKIALSDYVINNYNLDIALAEAGKIFEILNKQ
jgi:dephospho-CoA kinase